MLGRPHALDKRLMSWEREPSDSERPFHPGYGDNRELPHRISPTKPLLQTEAQPVSDRYLTRKEMMAEYGIETLRSSSSAREDRLGLKRSKSPARGASTDRSHNVPGRRAVAQGNSPGGRRSTTSSPAFNQNSSVAPRGRSGYKSTIPPSDVESGLEPSAAMFGWFGKPAMEGRVEPRISQRMRSQALSNRDSRLVPGTRTSGHESSAACAPASTLVPKANPRAPAALGEPRRHPSPSSVENPPRASATRMWGQEDTQPLLPGGQTSSSSPTRSSPQRSYGRATPFMTSKVSAPRKRGQKLAPSSTLADNAAASSARERCCRNGWGCLGLCLGVCLALTSLVVLGAVIVRSGAFQALAAGSWSEAWAAFRSNGPAAAASVYAQVQGAVLWISQQTPNVFRAVDHTIQGVLSSPPLAGAIEASRSGVGAALSAVAATQTAIGSQLAGNGVYQALANQSQALINQSQAIISPVVTSVVQQQQNIAKGAATMMKNVKQTVDNVISSEPITNVLTQGQKMVVSTQSAVQSSIDAVAEHGPKIWQAATDTAQAAGTAAMDAVAAAGNAIQPSKRD